MGGFVLTLVGGSDIDTLLSLLGSVQWWTLVSGAVLGTITVGLRTIMQAPIKALSERSKVIRLFSLLSPQRPFKGIWEVTWQVTSRRFAEVNADRVRVYSLFGNVTFTTRTALKDGTTEQCVFVGKLTDRTLTGRWFDPKDIDRAYFGVYQVRLGGSLRDAEGAWMGWTNDGEIQANKMTMKMLG